uniref:APO protein 3, mitochondrial n=1 Tax=Tanacetum cinerariifolium TaxID=118510 RepID=A0A6L2M4T6_TANCI|nr:APO protein 3, mitochondrial [Tanacetum cinerariifolium]
MHPRYLSSSIILRFDSLKKLQLHPTRLIGQSRTLTVDTTELPDADNHHFYADIPKPPKSKSERKPYPTPMKILVQRAKKEKEARKAEPCKLLEEPPENGLLVPQLVEVHIGRVGHEIRTCTGPKSGLRNATHVWRKGSIHDVIYFPKCFHLYDRVGKPRVVHDERRTVKQLPAIVELCIQAGLNLESYPTKRRIRPVYSIEGRIVDFELELETDRKIETVIDSSLDLSLNKDIDPKHDIRELGIVTLNSWFEMISGVKKIMEKYKVHTCGYCSEVQVGPKGHKVRNCKASKHQSRNGMHAWQEATISDLVGPNYVWHVSDPMGPPLSNDLKRYYGKAPAVVELCVQAGAPVPDKYRSMMRLDVVPPCRDELDLALWKTEFGQGLLSRKSLFGVDNADSGQPVFFFHNGLENNDFLRAEFGQMIATMVLYLYCSIVLELNFQYELLDVYNAWLAVAIS